MVQQSYKIEAGSKIPADIKVPLVGGGETTIARDDGARLVVFYRGLHCPLCRTYLDSLKELLPEFEKKEIDVLVVSTDDQGRAESVRNTWGYPGKLAYGLKVDDARRLGLYISQPRNEKETDHDFSEPGLIFQNASGKVHIVDFSNAPFARPDLKLLLNGIDYVLANDYPIRGTA
eukprot:Clim_evm55s199 gene=Clim_evmTU55s199